MPVEHQTDPNCNLCHGGGFVETIQCNKPMFRCCGGCVVEVHCVCHDGETCPACVAERDASDERAISAAESRHDNPFEENF